MTYKIIREYSVILKNGDELHTENKAEAEEFFQEHSKKQIHQYFRKDWEITNDEDPREGEVKVYFPII